MALKIKNIEQIKLNNIRECHLYLKVLNLKFEANFSPPFPENKKRCESIINNQINCIRSNKGNKCANEVLSILEEGVVTQLIPDSQFEWLDERNCRLIYFVWFYLRLADENKLSVTGHENPLPLLGALYNSQASSIDGLYNRVCGYPNPTSTKERLRAIINFFDHYFIDIQKRSEFLGYLKSYSHDLLSETKSVSWILADNRSQIDWAWNYLLSEKMISDILKPINDIERYNTIVVTLDFWNVHPAEKELFVLRMKKAWSQKKHRDGLVGKKPYNITMSNDIQGMLEKLAEHNDSKINKTLEKLIRKEHAKILSL